MVSGDYVLLVPASRSTSEVWMDLAQRLTKGVAAHLKPEYREHVQFEWENLYEREQNLVIKNVSLGSVYAVLEFRRDREFFVRDSIRSAYTREGLCTLLDGFKDIVCRRE